MGDIADMMLDSTMKTEKKDTGRLSMRLDTQLDSLLTERETKNGLTRSEIVREILMKELTGKNEPSYLMNELNTIKAGLREMLGLM